MTESSPQPISDAAGVKGKYNYAYFAQNITQQVPVPPPRKLTDEEIAAQQRLEQQQKAEGTSAWNAAGTFEERDWTEWAKERMGSLLTGESTSGSTTLSVTSVTASKGHANAWIVRGKKRHGFDFELSVSWTVQVAGQEGKGSVKIPNAASDELDDLCLESCEVVSGSKDVCSKAVEKMLPGFMQEKLAALLEELKLK